MIFDILMLLGSDSVREPGQKQLAQHWYDVISVSWESYGIELRIGLLGAILVAAALATLIVIKKRSIAHPDWETSEVTIKYGDLLEQKITPNRDTIRIAYQAWIEITTRKVGLAFEPEHDVLVEVYDSWFELFRVLRDLAKSVPAHRLRECPNTQRLVGLLISVLNEGLRPHLTKHQARFRRWYENALDNEKNGDRTPQEIQADFPDYGRLVEDLQLVNGQFVLFARSLQELAEGAVKR